MVHSGTIANRITLTNTLRLHDENFEPWYFSEHVKASDYEITNKLSLHTRNVDANYNILEIQGAPFIAYCVCVCEGGGHILWGKNHYLTKWVRLPNGCTDTKIQVNRQFFASIFQVYRHQNSGKQAVFCKQFLGLI